MSANNLPPEVTPDDIDRAAGVCLVCRAGAVIDSQCDNCGQEFDGNGQPSVVLRIGKPNKPIQVQSVDNPTAIGVLMSVNGEWDRRAWDATVGDVTH